MTIEELATRYPKSAFAGTLTDCCQMQRKVITVWIEGLAAALRLGISQRISWCFTTHFVDHRVPATGLYLYECQRKII